MTKIATHTDLAVHVGRLLVTVPNDHQRDTLYAHLLTLADRCLQVGGTDARRAAVAVKDAIASLQRLGVPTDDPGNWKLAAFQNKLLTALPLLDADVLTTGRKVRAPFAQANTDRANKTAAQRETWQAKAAALWAKPQHADKTNSDIARLIDKANWNTIRRYIRKPE